MSKGGGLTTYELPMAMNRRRRSNELIATANALASGAAGGSLAVLVAASLGVADFGLLTAIGAAGSVTLAAVERLGLFQRLFADRLNRCLQVYRAMFIAGEIDDTKWEEMQLHCLRRYPL